MDGCTSHEIFIAALIPFLSPLGTSGNLKHAHDQSFHHHLLAFGQHMRHGPRCQLEKTLTERLPSLPKIEEISKTPMAGVFEIRVQGNEIFTPMPKATF